MGLIPGPVVVPKVPEKSRAIPLHTLRACVAYKKGGNIHSRIWKERVDVSIHGAIKAFFSGMRKTIGNL